MNVIIEEEGHGVVEVFQDIPASMRKYLRGEAIPIGIHGDHFKALFQEFKGKGFSAYHNSYWMTAPVVLKAKGSESILELRIALRSMIRGTWDKISIGALPVHHFQMGFTPHVLTRAIFDQSSWYETFDIHFTLAYLLGLGLSYKQLDRFIKNIDDHQQAELSEYPHHCTPRMIDHVRGVLNNQYSAEGKVKYLEQAVETILFEALEEVSRAECTLPRLTAEALDKMYGVKALIESDCTLYRGNDALCQAVGTNKYYMHVWFKQVFGVTPEEHYISTKLMKAKELLAQGGSAASVAYEVGYATPSAFGAEFKKHFGYTPKEYQKQRGYW